MIVTALVRQDGAIGLTLWQRFEISPEPGESEIDAWFRQHNTPRRWELFGFRSIPACNP